MPCNYAHRYRYDIVDIDDIGVKYKCTSIFNCEHSCFFCTDCVLPWCRYWRYRHEIICLCSQLKLSVLNVDIDDIVPISVCICAQCNKVLPKCLPGLFIVFLISFGVTDIVVVLAFYKWQYRYRHFVYDIVDTTVKLIMDKFIVHVCFQL